MKHVLTCLIFLFTFFGVSAQSTNYYDRINHVFGAIDKNKVTTGFLKEFGVRLNTIESYNGTIGTTNWVDVTQWQSLYSSLYSMRVGPVASSMTDPSAVFAHLTTQQAGDPTVLLTAQYYTYQQYKINAHTNGDVTVVLDRIYDVTGRNPYETKTAFAVAPMKYNLEGNTFSFKLPSNMVYTNTAQTLIAIEIDFGNGQGYQIVSLNTLKSVSYSSGGEKELKIKFTYSGGTTLYSHAKLYINYIPNEAQARYSGSGLSFETITGAAYLGATATGDITIETAGTDGIFDKPLIIVEGFDPDSSNSYFDLINNDDNGGLNRVIDQSTGRTLNQAIEDEGYDLVFVNYRNGTDYIQRNAYMVEAVIEWVNNSKVGNEKNVVLGMSMGGLVARYALRHMEVTLRTHQTKLYISHDAPHQGANVPLAYQAFVRHLAGESIGWPVFLGFYTFDIIDLNDIAPSLDDGLALLQSPAAQQMLAYQLSGTGTSTAINTNSMFSSFTAEYRNLGYPNQGGIRNIAISNGSECGTPLEFSPYATLASINKAIDLPFFTTNIVFTILNTYSGNPIRTLTSFLSTNTDIKAEFDLKALPDQQSQQIYKGRIYIKKKVLGFINVEEALIGTKTLNSTSSMLPLDNAGGGIYNINKFITSLPSSLSEFIKQKRFTFIPTYSSLDIGAGVQPVTATGIARVYSPLAPPAAPKNTPFHNFFTNPTISENHVQFTLNNGNWLLEELDSDGTPAFYSCVSSCTTTPPDLNITGPSLVCSSGGTFTLPNVSPLATVTWQATPPNFFMAASGSGTSAMLKLNSSNTQGQGTLTFTIGNSCGASTQLSKSFWVGKPSFQYPIQGPSQLVNNYSGQYLVPYALGVSNNYNYTWAMPAGWTLYISEPAGSGHSATIIPRSTGFKTISVITSNTCGSAHSEKTVESITADECSPQISAYPNPSKGDVVINIIPPPPNCDTPIEFSSVSTRNNSLILRNSTGVKIIEKDFLGTEIELKGLGLKPGLYYLEVLHMGKKLERKLIVN